MNTAKMVRDEILWRFDDGCRSFELTDVAIALGLMPRTLEARLYHAQLRFREIVRPMRVNYALDLMENGMGMEVAAHEVGYHKRGFQRAVHELLMCTPSEAVLLGRRATELTDEGLDQ